MTMHITHQELTSSEPVLKNDRPNMLVVGNIARWCSQGRVLPANENCWFIGFDALCPEILSKLKPSIILSPLVGDGFDAIDVAGKLSQMLYKGPYRAVSGVLPNPASVSSEVSENAPSVDFDLVILPLIAASNPA